MFDTTASLFGITEGESYPTQVLTVDLPRDAVDDLEAGTVSASAYVNSVMNSTQSFFIQVTDLQSVGGTPQEPSADTKDMQITANVEESVSAPSYTVTVPSSVELGTLSTEEDNAMPYVVDVTASDLNGEIAVTAPETGSLTSDGNTLAFSNSFKTQTVNADTAGTKLSGTISIGKDAVAAAKAGNYTGTTTFTITYKAN